MTDRSPPAGRPATTAGLVLASITVMAFLGVWEPSKSDPGLVYADRLANGLPTVCSGLTRHVTDTPIVVGERWSAEKCAAEEQRAMIERVQRPLLRCFKVVPPQSVFDAASSHAWNFGVGATCTSTSMSAWNRRDWSLGCQRIYVKADGRPNWSYSDGRFVQGLQNRRRSEYALCMKDVIQ